MTPLGDESRPFHLLAETSQSFEIHYVSCTVQEAVNDLFSIDVQAVAKSTEVDFNDFIGRHMTVAMSMQGHTDGGAEEITYFDGIVTEGVWEGPAEEDMQRYRFRLESWLAVAARRKNMRIFHEKTVIEILEEIFADYSAVGSRIFRDDTRGSYGTWEYTVQYNESDLNFVRRLMERAGISFYFAHDVGSHTLVLFDEIEALPEISGGSIPLKPHASVHSGEGRNLTTWMPRRGLVTGAKRVIDYNFKEPRRRLDKEETGSRGYSLGQLESYEYPGNFRTDEDATKEARLRLRAAEGEDARILSMGLAYDLRAGMRFELDASQADAPHDGAFVCMRATHILPTQSYHTGSTASNFEYSGSYEMAPADAPHAPPKVTPKIQMPGPQTAVVSGGSTTDCDEYGRILVTFHWDTQNARSMRCRVSQSWAGSGFGAFVLPRQGMEVIVEFINGDPDHPIVTGCVYNHAHMPPYDMPANASRSTFRTQSVDAAGNNELRFEDKAGDEEVFLLAQKNANIFVKNNATEHVLNDKAVRVDNDMMQSAARNLIYSADNAMEISVGTARVDQVLTGNEEGNYTSEFQMIEGSCNAADTAGDLSIYASNNIGITAGADYDEEIASNKSSSVGIDQSIEVGSNYTLDAGNSIELTAANEIKLTVGQNSITINNQGITLDAINISASAVAQASLSSPNTSVSGSGMLSLEGGVVKVQGMIKLN